jgi:hypothetical protein
MEKPLTHVPELGMSFSLNFATLDYKVDLALEFMSRLDVEFLR